MSTTTPPSSTSTSTVTIKLVSGDRVKAFLESERHFTAQFVRAQMDTMMDAMMGPMVERLFGALKDKFDRYLSVPGYVVTQVPTTTNDHHKHHANNDKSSYDLTGLDLFDGADDDDDHFPESSVNLLSIQQPTEDPGVIAVDDEDDDHHHEAASTTTIEPQQNRIKQEMMTDLIELPNQSTNQIQNNPINHHQVDENDEEDDEDDCECDECLYGIKREYSDIEENYEDDDDETVIDSDNDHWDSDDQGAHEDEPPAKKQRTTENESNNESITNNQNNHQQQQQHYITLSVQCFQPKCSLVFDSQDRLNIHLKQVHSVLRNRCYLKGCGLTFDNTADMRTHLLEAHPKLTKWKCSHCASHYRSLKNLRMHNFDHHHLGQFQCSFDGCQFVAQNRKSVYKHYGAHHNPRLTCAHCEKQFTKPYKFEQHERQHLGIKPYRCRWEGCDYANATQAYTMKHIVTAHYDAKSIAGAYKNKKVIRKFGDPKEWLEVLEDLLPKESRRSTGTKQLKPHLKQCTQSGCSYANVSATRLKQHERTHLGLKPYRCRWPDCAYACAFRANVISHIRIKHFDNKNSRSSRDRETRQFKRPQDCLEVMYDLLV